MAALPDCTGGRAQQRSWLGPRNCRHAQPCCPTRRTDSGSRCPRKKLNEGHATNVSTPLPFSTPVELRQAQLRLSRHEIGQAAAVAFMSLRSAWGDCDDAFSGFRSLQSRSCHNLGLWSADSDRGVGAPGKGIGLVARFRRYRSGRALEPGWDSGTEPRRAAESFGRSASLSTANSHTGPRCPGLAAQACDGHCRC